MRRNIIYSILSLILVMVGILAAIVVVRQQQVLEKKAAPATSLRLTTTTPTPSVDQTFTVSVDIDTAENLVIGTELALSFDADILEALDITPGPFFPDVQIRDTNLDNANGSIFSVVYVLPGQGQERRGTGTIATIRFRVLQAGSTTIEFEPNTIVAAIGEDVGINVLVHTIPLTVECIVPVAETDLWLNPPATLPRVNETFSIPVVINTNSNTVIGSELYLNFYANQLEALDIEPSTFLPNVQTRDKFIDNTNGTISYVLFTPLPPEGSPQQGTGTLAILTFRALQPGDTTISFDTTRTIVAGVGGNAGINLLDEATPLTITVSSAPTPTPTHTPLNIELSVEVNHILSLIMIELAVSS